MTEAETCFTVDNLKRLLLDQEQIISMKDASIEQRDNEIRRLINKNEELKNELLSVYRKYFNNRGDDY